MHVHQPFRTSERSRTVPECARVPSRGFHDSGAPTVLFAVIHSSRTLEASLCVHQASDMNGSLPTVEGRMRSTANATTYLGRRLLRSFKSTSTPLRRPQQTQPCSTILILLYTVVHRRLKYARLLETHRGESAP